ncbi:hypothetical protein [Algicella marina]|uniref:Uncharacterized protein n=1 Tax=Algicella marina TaxID=2683284 RepID=A0A6P1SUD7_9RHOB|nr:hypothetical protein [Algicella marina]QHQ34048.1 hypothetical protein GO499_02025 [Algicella marina]
MTAAIAVLGFGLAGCEDAGGTGGTFAAPVTRDYGVAGVNWADRREGYTYVYKVVDVDGELYVCGAGFHEGQTRRKANRQALRAHAFVVNGETVLVGTAHFAEYADEEALVAGTANCRATGKPTPSGPLTVEVEALRSRVML